MHRSPTEKPSMPRSSTSVMKASRSAARERAMRGSRSAAAVVAGAEAADVGDAAVEAAGIAAGAGAATAAPVAESEAGIGAAISSAACASCALVAVFDAVKCPPWVQSSGLLNRLIIIQHLVQ